MMKLARASGASYSVLFPGGESAGAGPFAAPGGGPIVLYCDLAMDPSREREILYHFHCNFKPAAEKFDGYIDLRVVRLPPVQGERLGLLIIAFSSTMRAKIRQL